jgi:hypothetical protein
MLMLHKHVSLRRRLGLLAGAIAGPSIALHAIVALCVLYWYDDVNLLQGTSLWFLIAALIPLSWLAPMFLEDIARRWAGSQPMH